MTASTSPTAMSSSGKNTQSNHKEGSCVSFMQNGSVSKGCTVLTLFIFLSGFLWLHTGTIGQDRNPYKEALCTFSALNYEDNGTAMEWPCCH